jgi:hypothetical protein
MVTPRATASVLPTATATAGATPTVASTPTPTPSPAPTAGPGVAACADGIDNDGDRRIDHPADKGCQSLEDPYEQKGKSWKLRLAELARERGISKKRLRREIRGTAEEQQLIELGMPPPR